MVFWPPWFWGMMAGFVIALILILAVAIIFWLWMLIDVLQRKRFEDKLVWVVVMIFLFVIGSILYYFLVYREKSPHRRR